MLIEDQCEGCQKHGTTTCPEEKPSGWLAFFLYWSMPIGAVASLIMNLASCSAEGFGYLDVCLSASLLALAVITIIRFVKHKPDAVILAKTYLIVCFVVNVLVLIMGGAESGTMTTLVRSLVIGVAWFWYLCASEQVERIIPKSTRKFTPLAKWAIAVFVAFPLITIVLSVASSIKDLITMNDEITEEMLLPDERTDGKFVFNVPEGFEVDSTVLDDSQVTVFTLLKGDEVSYALYCEYMEAEDFTQETFDEVWESWDDEDLDEFQSMVDRSSPITINGNPAFLKVVKYYSENGSAYWYFAMIHHEITGKTAAVSSYRAESEYSSEFIDFLNGIQFYK